jgi:hypothetical protein
MPAAQNSLSDSRVETVRSGEVSDGRLKIGSQRLSEDARLADAEPAALPFDGRFGIW